MSQNILYSFAASLLLAFPTVGNAQGKAAFSDFVYQGNDDYYTEHPLTSDCQAYNPILPGWYSDPSICADGRGNYYLTTSTFGWYPGVPLFHSRDLMNWRQLGYVLNRTEQLPLETQTMGKEGIYASSIFYNKANETYYMISTNLGLMTHYYKPGTFVVKTKDPANAWSEPIYLQGMGGIDPSMFFDDDGKAYVIYCRMRNDEYPGRNSIIMQEYDIEADTVKTETAKIIADKGAFPEQQPMCLEGPHLYKVNGRYYLLCAEGGTEMNHSEVVFRSDSIWGTYQSYSGNPILTQRDLGIRSDGVYCAGHADIFQDGEGNWWSVFLGMRLLDGKSSNLGRETFLMPVTWTDDGWPIIMRKGESVPRIITIPNTCRGDHPTFGNFSWRDDFSTEKLSIEWQMVRGDASSLYRLSDGKLWLTCGKTASDVNATPAYLGRRLQHHQFVATTTMAFTPSEQEAAGIALIKSESRQYVMAVSKASGVEAVNLYKIGDEGRAILMASSPICHHNEITLRIVSADGRTFDFLYSLDGGKNFSTLCSNIDASYLSTNIEGTADSFTGTLIGPYVVENL